MRTGRPDPSAWTVLHSSVKGLKKKYSQDSHRAGRTAHGAAALLAVADGHGSAAHFRSDLGARWAVEEFARCAEPFARQAAELGGDASRWRSLRAAARELPVYVVRNWRRRVALHEASAPADGRTEDRELTGADTEKYGSTLVGAVVTPRLLVCWQLGDGDVVLVRDGGVPETPLYGGPELGDETESLCQQRAAWRTRVHWQVFPDRPPPAVLLSTDGLSKSFTGHSGFLDFASGVAQRVRHQGPRHVGGQLDDWLAQAAGHSGDDTTLVGAFPETVIAPGTPNAPGMPTARPEEPGTEGETP